MRNPSAASPAYAPPWPALGFWALLWLPGLLLGLPEAPWAGAFSALFAVLAWRWPRQALWVLFLGTAWFLGAPRRPYIWLLSAWHWTWLVLANLRLRMEDKDGGLAATGWLWLLPLVALASPPLSQGEFLARWWATTWSVLGQQFLGPNSDYVAYPVRLVVDFAAGALTCGTIWRLWTPDQARRDLAGAGMGLALIMTVMAAAGLVLYYFPEARGGRFLSLPLEGVEYGGLGMAGLTYNRQYLLMFLLAAGPLAGLAAWAGRPTWLGRALAGLALAGLLAVVAHTGQRLPALVLAALAAGALLLLKGRRLRLVLAGLALGALLVLGVDWLRGWPILGKLASTGLGDAYVRIWRVAARIFAAHPLLGVGTGQYAWHVAWSLAQDPSSSLVITEARGTPHQWWLMLAADQGLAGLVVWLGCLGALLARVLGQARRAQSAPLVALAITLLVLLAFSLVQTLFYFPAFALFFWVVLGFAGLLAAPPEAPAWPAGRWNPGGALATLAVVAVLAGGQLWLGHDQEPGAFAAGLHGREVFGGVPGRWLAPRAALTTPPGEKPWRICLNSFLPDLAGRPQELSITRDGEPLAHLRWTEPAWHEVSLAPDPRGRATILRLASDRVYNPRREGVGEDRRDLAVVLNVPEPGAPCPGN